MNSQPTQLGPAKKELEPQIRRGYGPLHQANISSSITKQRRKFPELGKKARLVGAGITVREEGKEGMREGKEREDGERKGRRKRWHRGELEGRGSTSHITVRCLVVGDPPILPHCDVGPTLRQQSLTT